MLTNAQMNTVENTHFGPVIGVHEGFMSRFLFLLPSVQQIIASFDIDRIVFVGHSMGAAVATLMALEYRNTKRVTCFTLAAPIMGDSKFRKLVRNFFGLLEARQTK